MFKSYLLIYEDGVLVAIKCLVCNITSYNMNDVKNKYCGNCHQFHDL